VDEARRVIERLERIESLKRAGAPADELLAEVRALLRDGEAWLAAEPDGTRRAREALERCDVAIGREAGAAA
jgi:hypothetical protein